MDDRIFRVRINLAFPADGEEDVEECVQDLQPFLAKAITINEGLPNEEKGFISVSRCGHETVKPCELIEKWET